MKMAALSGGPILAASRFDTRPRARRLDQQNWISKKGFQTTSSSFELAAQRSARSTASEQSGESLLKQEELED